MLRFSVPVTAFFDTSLHISKTKHGFHHYYADTAALRSEA